MAKGNYIRNGNKTRDKLMMRGNIEYIVPRVYAALACCLWDKGWTAEDIQELFTASQERWLDSVRNNWDMLENVAEVTGIDVRYFRTTGNIV